MHGEENIRHAVKGPGLEGAGIVVGRFLDLVEKAAYPGLTQVIVVRGIL